MQKYYNFTILSNVEVQRVEKFRASQDFGVDGRLRVGKPMKINGSQWKNSEISEKSWDARKFSTRWTSTFDKIMKF